MGNLHYGSTSVMLLLIFLVISQTDHFVYSSKAYANVSCINSERRALLKIRENLVDNANRLSSWVGKDCCTWQGVECSKSTGHVVKLDLHNPVKYDYDRYFSDVNYQTYYDNNCLRGEIDPSILDLEQLHYLDVSLNHHLTTEIPYYFGSLKNMRYLNLISAGFGGEIPYSLGNLSNLEYLYLGESPDQWQGFYNFLTANTLEWIAGLSSLKSLYLYWVDIYHAQDWFHSINMLHSLSSLEIRNCELPNMTFPLFNNLTSLALLDLGQSSFYGSTLPNWLFNLSSLVQLHLDGNSFAGPIPDEFEKLNSLTVLDISVNNFSSSVPSSLSTLASLTHMNLENSHFQGSVPHSLGNLTSLVSLNLRDNKFSGKIPCEMSHLKQLTSLNLGSNYLEGPIPSCIGQLANLKILYLSDNKLYGTVPTTIGQLLKLQELDISNASLTGVLSEVHFAKLKELKVLSISSNSLLSFKVSSQWIPPFQLREIHMNSIPIGPQFPSWLQTQRNVQKLSMENASISDIIPDWFEILCSSMEELSLSSNNISGEVPQCKKDNMTLFSLASNKFQGHLKPFPPDLVFLDLSNNFLTGPVILFDEDKMNNSLLESLNLGDNHFNGTFPDYLCNISSLRVISLANNWLTGRIPVCLGNLHYLNVLNLGNNNFSGQIPSTLGNLNLLIHLHLNRNHFHGKLPPSLKNLKRLVTLDLGENQLKDSIPEWIGEELSLLQFLTLQSNDFYGDIPVHLCQLSSLQILNLAQNKLTGYIPHCFHNLSKMASSDKGIYYGFNVYTETLSTYIKGRELVYSSNLQYVKSIILSGNNLVGGIPTDLMDLEGLQSLNLSNNHLSGMIPEKIGNLKQLESLDLSMNQISGPIPPGLATINSLNYLNLSFNQLSGRIPSGNQLQTLTDQSIYEGNSGLCGKPLPSCPDENSSEKNGSTFVEKGHDDDFEFLWFYAGMGPGFAIGLLGVFCLLLFKKSWRHAFFGFIENVYDRIQVVIAMKNSQLSRKFH